MKKLSKLQISPEKRLTDEELKTISGGEWCGFMYVDCPSGAFSGPTCAANEETAYLICTGMWGPAGCTCHSYQW